MSHASPHPSPWRKPPVFSTAHTGYLSGDVESLLDALEDAAARGEPLESLIDARSLSTVSFGDDMSEVDSFLAELRSNDAQGVHSTPDPVPTPESVFPGALEDPLNAGAQQILALVDAARFRIARRSVTGYEVGSVDDFLDTVVTQAEAGESVLPTIRSVRFPMAPRGSSGYMVDDVDDLLGKIQLLASGDGPAVSDNTVNGPDKPSTRKGVATAVLWILGIAIILYLALFVL